MKKPKFLSIMVIFSLLLCIIYGVVAVVFQWITGTEISPTLTERWFQVFGIEIAGTTLIYIVKRVTSIWRIQDRIKLKKEEGFKLKESDFDLHDTSDYFVHDDPIYDDGDDNFDENDLMG